MFLAATGRPHFDFHKKQYIDGKVGIWSLVFKEPTQLNSKNCPKETLVTEPVEI